MVILTLAHATQHLHYLNLLGLNAVLPHSERTGFPENPNGPDMNPAIDIHYLPYGHTASTPFQPSSPKTVSDFITVQLLT